MNKKFEDETDELMVNPRKDIHPMCVYLDRELWRAVKIKLIEDGKRQSFSGLVIQLLKEWLNEEEASVCPFCKSKETQICEIKLHLCEGCKTGSFHTTDDRYAAIAVEVAKKRFGPDWQTKFSE